MKAILLIFVILLGVWLWSSSRPTRPRQGQDQSKADNKPPPLDMVSCAFCSIHLPAAESIKGNNGVYCSADHLARVEHQG